MSKKNYNIAWPQGARINRRRQYLPRDFSADEILLVEHYSATAVALRRRSRKAGTQMQIPANAKTTPARAGAEYPKPAAITAPPMIAPAALAVFSAAWLRAAARVWASWATSIKRTCKAGARQVPKNPQTPKVMMPATGWVEVK